LPATRTAWLAKSWLAVVAAAFALLMCLPTARAQPKLDAGVGRRVALVIGNGAAILGA
jgi:hypothetical protein